MTGWLSALAQRADAPRWLIGAAILIALMLLAWLALAAHDRRVIAAHDAARDLTLSESARAADASAAARRRDDDRRIAAEAAQLEKGIADAPTEAAPDAARRAYYRCVGLQQAARVAGDPAPAC